MVGLATFFFEASEGDERVLVPAPAVVGGIDKKNFVWVYDPDSQTVKKCSVQVGNLTSYGLQIKEGLDPGDIVVTRGVHCLEEGIQVRLLDRP
jgi:multidrug efflux pump subunit AcrA (membrane-fusion protein)